MKKAIHHTSPTGKVCSICGKQILNIWYDQDEQNGRSETFQERKYGSIVHYFCIPNAKTLQQLNDERGNIIPYKRYY